MRRKLTTEEFIQRANEVHSNKYDYSKSIYRGSNIPIIITCPIHGDFIQNRPLHHLEGVGCPKCGREKTRIKRALTTKQFIEKTIQIHGNKYDYSKVNYINNSTKVTIICPEHGEFDVAPFSHLEGVNCPKCAHRGYKYTTAEWVEKAKQIHGDRYNYSKTNYIDSKTEVCIICPKHGEFWQLPSNHLKGKGCSKCGKESMANKKRKTLKQFIQEAKQIHGDKYDYSKVQYKNNKEKVEIICPIHGSFWQIAKHHLNGCGCPMCNSSKGENIIKNYLDKNNINYLSQYEINVPKNIRISSKAYIDFYLPDYNTFIEYNGEQHYVPKEHFGGQIVFEYQQIRDNFLSEYCKNNNIKLIVISYKQKDIENYLALNLKQTIKLKNA